MTANELHDLLVNKRPNLYWVTHGRVVKLSIAKEGGIDPMTDEGTFCIGFKRPQRYWGSHNALPFIKAKGTDGNGKIMTADYYQGGYDLSGSWFTLDEGDVYVSEDAANKASKAQYKEYLVEKMEKKKDSIRKADEKLSKLEEEFKELEQEYNTL